MRIFICCILLSITTVSFAQKNEEETKIDRPTYSISVPSDWSVDTSKLLGVDMIVRSVLADSTTDFMENLNIFYQDLSQFDYDLTRLGEESRTQLKKVVTDFELLDYHLDSSGAEPFYVLNHRGRHGLYTLITKQRFYLKNKFGYAFTITIQAGKEEEFNKIAEEIFNSIIFR